MSRLLTKNPLALGQLMSEAIFSLPTEDHSILELDVPVQSSKLSPPIPVKAVEPLVYWGDNKRHVVFFVRQQGFDYFSKEAEEAFLKTLGALKLSLSEIAVVNLATTAKSMDDILETLQPIYRIFCVGETAGNATTFNILQKKGPGSVLYTYSFEEMLTDTAKKRLFWNSIKGING